MKLSKLLLTPQLLIAMLFCVAINAQSIDETSGTIYNGITESKRNSIPISATSKAIVNNTTSDKLEFWDGSNWIEIGKGSDLIKVTVSEYLNLSQSDLENNNYLIVDEKGEGLAVSGFLKVTVNEYLNLTQNELDNNDYLIVDEKGSSSPSNGDMLKSVYDTNDNGTVDSIDDSSINSDKIIDNSISTIDLVNGIITNPKLALNSVDTNNIVSDAIVRGLIDDGAVGQDQLDDNSVTSNKIVNGTIVKDDISTSFYEEGTFTPGLIDGLNSSGNGSYTLSSSTGNYIKIGKLIYVTITIGITSTSGTPDDHLFISGLPFNLSGSNARFNATMTGGDFDFYSIQGIGAINVTGSTSGIGFKAQKSLDNNNFDAVTSVSFTSGSIILTGVYTTN